MLKTSYEVSPFLIIIVYILAVCVLSLCCFLIYIYIYDFYLFIFGCAGSSLLCGLFSSCSQQGLLWLRLLIAVASLAVERWL